MLSYTTYSEAGGVGKTTLTANLAQAHAEHGRDVLVIDLDPQDGSLTYLLGIPVSRETDDDNIARHLIDRPNGPFKDLIHSTGYGFDIIPSHNMLENLGGLLSQAQEIADDLDESFNTHNRLQDVLTAANIPEAYDTIIVDPPATAGPHLYNAVTATRSLVIPVEPTGKGIQSVEGLEDVVLNLEEELGFNVGVLAIVPNGVGTTTDQDRYVEQITTLGYDAPVAFRDRTSLFEGSWDQQCTAFYFVGHHRSQQRDYEVETLDKIRRLARHIEDVGDI